MKQELNTIREALELLVTRIDNDSDSSTGSRAIFAIDRLEAHLSAQQQPKRLTDEVIDNYVRKYKHPYSTEIRRAITHFRDNGYLGGLTVDEVMDVVLTWHNYSDMSEEQAQELCGNETPEEAYEDLHARLTAKMNER